MKARIIFRRFNNVDDTKEEVVLFSFGEKIELANEQFASIQDMLIKQCEERLVDIFTFDKYSIHYTRTSLSNGGVYPNEDCYYNLVF